MHGAGWASGHLWAARACSLPGITRDIYLSFGNSKPVRTKCHSDFFEVKILPEQSCYYSSWRSVTKLTSFAINFVFRIFVWAKIWWCCWFCLFSTFWLGLWWVTVSASAPAWRVFWVNAIFWVKYLFTQFQWDNLGSVALWKVNIHFVSIRPFLSNIFRRKVNFGHGGSLCGQLRNLHFNTNPTLIRLPFDHSSHGGSAC